MEEEIVIELKENLLPLSCVPKYLPEKRGQRLSIKTVYRWAQRGLSGIQLETLQVGGTLYTSEEALARFFNAITCEKRREKTDCKGQDHSTATSELRKAGFDIESP
ncbi:MAG: hypothetical protein Aurels2KO_21950 [Aureliella sp.]